MRERFVQRTILVVDDDPETLNLFSVVLSSRGMNPIVAATGEEAIEKLHSTSPDLVLLDLSLPDMTGWDVLARIRQTTSLAHLPVIASTAFMMVGDREAALDFGFDGFLAKPFQVTTLLQEIQTCLDISELA